MPTKSEDKQNLSHGGIARLPLSQMHARMQALASPQKMPHSTTAQTTALLDLAMRVSSGRKLLNQPSRNPPSCNTRLWPKVYVALYQSFVVMRSCKMRSCELVAPAQAP